jgi:hypothetical protein
MRKPRGRNPFTTTALRRAVNVARETGIERVEVELPGGSRLVFPITSKQEGDAARQDQPHNPWDEVYDQNEKRTT